MRRLLSVAAAGAVITAPALAVGTATPAAAEPAREPVKAQATTSHLTVRGLTGLVAGNDAIDVRVGVTHATADSAGPAGRKATADASNFSAAAGGNRLPNPTQVSQAAPPDHATPTTASLSLDQTPLGQVVHTRLLSGQAQARWTEASGACTGTPLSRGQSTVADLAVLSSGPLAGVPALSNLLGGNAVLLMPGTVRSLSDVTLRPQGNGRGSAVVATSVLQVAEVTLFFNSPMQTTVRVVNPPTLRAISTGDAATSKIEYSAPILEVFQGGRSLGRIDAAHPTMNLPLAPGLPRSLNLGAVKLSIGQLSTGKDPNSAVSAHAALLDLKILPLSGSGALARLTAGEQEVGALAPRGGVDCQGLVGGGDGSDGNGDSGDSGDSDGNGSGSGQDGDGGQVDSASMDTLPVTNAAYDPLPYVTTGGALLLLGSLLVAAVPRRRRARGADDAA